ncbi:hypothetical protein L3X38_027345 [Prunus dulcis]|uniref:Uncharacterized protein n=1 Tax=Prunus dulcis TaxID=3755 RepID=A0AAD4VP95_PRUDU|nr:hypothetical protein L3X38_027345 [Prunus dulcis]
MGSEGELMNIGIHLRSFGKELWDPLNWQKLKAKGMRSARREKLKHMTPGDGISQEREIKNYGTHQMAKTHSPWDRPGERNQEVWDPPHWQQLKTKHTITGLSHICKTWLYDLLFKK